MVISPLLLLCTPFVSSLTEPLSALSAHCEKTCVPEQSWKPVSIPVDINEI